MNRWVGERLVKEAGGLRDRRVKTLHQFIEAPAGLTCRRGGFSAPTGLAGREGGLQPARQPQRSLHVVRQGFSPPDSSTVLTG
jgi:hypothetical protein